MLLRSSNIRGDDVHQILTRRASTALLTVLAVVGGVLAGSPAQAADPPSLTSVTVAPTTVAAPGTAQVTYTAEGPPVALADAVFVDDRGVQHKVVLTPGSTGAGTLTVPTGTETSTWRLGSVRLRSEPDLITKVCGTFWALHVSDCTVTRDLSAGDVTVRGMTPEYDAPQLASVTVSPAAPLVVGPERQANLAWTLRSPAPDLAYVSARFTNRSTGQVGVILDSRDPVALAAGRFGGWVAGGTPNGLYDLTSFMLCDKSFNCAEYHPDGSVTLARGARTPTGAQPTFSGTFDVNSDPPVLTSIRLAAPTVLVGKPVVVSYAVQNRQATLDGVRLLYTYQGDGLRDVEVRRLDAPRTGTISQVMDRIGLYHLDSIVVHNGYTPALEYRSDGTVVNLRFNQVVGTHQFDLRSLDIRVIPKPPKLTARAWARGARIDFNPGMNDDIGNITGYEMVAEPGHHVSRVTGTNLYTAYVKGLTAGTKYTVKVTSLSAAGPSPATTFTGTPMLTSNVVGIGDLNRDRHGDLVALRRDWTHTFGYWGNGKGGFNGGVRNIADVVPGTRILPAGDLTGDGQPDLIAEHVGRLELYQGTNGGFLTDPTIASTGWSSMRFITGGGDFSGDGRADVLGVTPTGVLNLYAGNGRGKVATGRQIGSGWQTMTSVFMTADFNGDRTRDILAVDQAGVLWLYPGNGKGGFRGVRSKVGTGWNTLGSVGPLGDFTGDGKADVVGITMAGEFRLYAGNGTGRVYAGRVIGTGWQRYF